MPTHEDRKSQYVTAVVDAWPYTPNEIERAVYSAMNLADRVMIAVPDELSPYQEETLPGIPGEVQRIPFWGNFVTLRNQVVERIDTSWVFFLGGNEEFLAADTSHVLQALNPQNPEIFKMVVATGEQGQILAEPVRILPVNPHIRYTGRIWPQITGSLMEFGYPLKSLDAHIFRLENRASTIQVTRRLRADMTEQEKLQPRNWRIKLRLAMLSWAEHRFAEAMKRLAALPKILPDEVTEQLREGLTAICWLEQGQYEKALDVVRTHLRRSPERADLWVIGGQALIGLNRHAEAVTYLGSAMRYEETSLPYLDPGYATYTARLLCAQAEMAAGRVSKGLASLLALLEEYPSYRAAWQEVLSHLTEIPSKEVFATMETVIAPPKIRHFFSLLTHPTEDERRIQQWLAVHQTSY